MQTKKLYLIRSGEVALKGANKPYFERMLLGRIAQVLKPYPEIALRREDGLILAETPEDLKESVFLSQVSKVSGVESISPATSVESKIASIERAAVDYVKVMQQETGFRSFKVEAKRSDKTFPILSPDIEKRVGSVVLSECPGISVDVHHPDQMVFIHVRRERTYLYGRKIPCLGGLPIGTNGKGLVLLSGGIDSPVAAFLMANRGMFIEAVHFHSFPYTSERAFEKVLALGQILTETCGKIKIHSINLLPIQEKIVSTCNEDETTILVRRFMMRIAERVAKETGSLMLITGENLGQVASQTAESLVVTDEATTLPVMRPRIGMHKTEIIEKARQIGTFETSILPYEDCCTVFLPKHPVTKPTLEQIQNSEALLQIEALVDEAMESKVSVLVSPGWM